MTSMPSAARAVAEKIGEERIILHSPEVTLLSRDMGEPPELFERLLTGKRPEFAVQPRDVTELSTAVRILASEGVPITPRGLGSCGVGGAVPVAGGAVLDLSRLDQVFNVNEAGGTATVGGGVSFYFIQQALARSGRSLLARPTNAFGTIGGWASAGGMGLGSLAAGPITEQVEDVQVVLPGGDVVNLSRGENGFSDCFDTEGQLGIFSRLTLRLRPADEHSEVVGYVLPDLEQAQAAMAQVLASDPWPRTAMLAGNTRELEGLQDAEPGEALLLELLPGKQVGLGGAGRLPKELALRLWNRRFFPMDSPMGPVFLASEAILPVDEVAGFIKAARRLGKRYGVPLHAHSYAVSHGGETGVLVLLLFPSDPRQGWHHLMLTPLAAVLTSAAVRRGGKPYGVGIWNTPFVRQRFGEERLAYLQQRKEELDPRGLLNPGKFFQVGTEAKALPAVMNPGFYPTSLRMASVTTPMMMSRHDPSEKPSTVADRCVACGACVPVCPAMAATGTETVSARAKLTMMRRLDRDEAVGAEELLGAMRCLECGQCEEVCARSLPLVETWNELEQHVRAVIDGEGEPDRTIRAFTELVDDSRDQVMKVALS